MSWPPLGLLVLLKAKRGMYKEILTYYYNELPITFRATLDRSIIEIKFDDNFAKANGYENREAMIQDIHSASPITVGVIIPEWLDVSNGEFSAMIQTPLCNN